MKDFKKHTTPDNLEKYSFLWSEVRLIIAAVALFLGGFPPILKIMPYSLYSTTSSLLTICWIISGVAAAYLLWRWYNNDKKIFGGNNKKDVVAFLVATISGLNLGIAGILGTNIGMNISMNQAVFVITGILYIISAGYLYKRWNESGKKLFNTPTVVMEEKTNNPTETNQEN